MARTRRDTLGLLGVGTAIALAGCLAPESDDAGAVVPIDSQPLAVRSSRPHWQETDDAVGFVAVLDGPDRAATARSQFTLPEERAEAVETFVTDTDFETERLLLVESVGPSACYGEVVFSSVRLDGETVRATAVATAQDADACAAVITYPSALLRVAFDGTPVDSAAVTIQDGRGRETSVAGSTTSDLAGFAPRN